MTQCTFDLHAPNVVWAFCPSEAAALLFCILFACTTLAHLVQAILTKKKYCAVIIISGLAQTAAFAFRVVSMHNPTSTTFYAIWFVLILVAPLFTNAFAYMVMGRMVWNFMPDQKVFKIKAWRMGTIFVLLDVVAFLIQLFGASLASGTNVSTSRILLGLHIYMAGIGIQQFFILIFVELTIRFNLKLRREPKSNNRSKAFRLLYVLYAVLLLITVRICFRLVEYSNGLKSTISNKEVFMYCLDSLPMLTALILFNIVHPGVLMPGEKWPGRGERRTALQAGQQIAPAGKYQGSEYNLLPVTESRSASPLRYNGSTPMPPSRYEATRY